jgi:hypothetical protein
MEEKKDDKKRILAGMPLKDAIFRCGELQLLLEDVCWLLAEQTDPKQLMKDLQDTQSEAYAWYNQGVAEGNLKLNIDLEYNVSEPKAKDAYKHLSAERRRQAINKKLDELFGI